MSSSWNKLELAKPTKKQLPDYFKFDRAFGDPHKRNANNLLSSIPEPDIVTFGDDSNDPTFTYGFGAQQPIVPPSLNNLNLLPNPFNILAISVVQQNLIQQDHDYSPQSPEPSEPSPTSAPPMKVSTFNSWETPHTTTDDTTFYSEDKPRRVYWTFPLNETFQKGEPRRIYLLSSPSPPSPPRKMKRKVEMGMSFQTEGECRSMSARPADKRFPQQRTSKDLQLKTKNYKNNNKLMILFKYM